MRPGCAALWGWETRHDDRRGCRLHRHWPEHAAEAGLLGKNPRPADRAQDHHPRRCHQRLYGDQPGVRPAGLRPGAASDLT